MNRFLVLAVTLLIFASCTVTNDDPLLRDFSRLQLPAKSYVDDWGNHHIYAADKYDASFLQCYQAAHERLFQMDYTRRNIRGELAEWFGESEIENDKARRVIGFRRIAEKNWAHFLANERETAGRILACVGGANAYLNDIGAGRHGARLTKDFTELDPAYFPREFTPIDIIAYAKGMAFSLSFSADFDFYYYVAQLLMHDDVFADLVRFEPVSPTAILEGTPLTRWGLQTAPVQAAPRQVQRVAVPPYRALTAKQASKALLAVKRLNLIPSVPDRGSNNWVIAGGKTKSGFPLIANDPHLGLQLPSTFLETHLRYEENGEPVDVTGIMLAGGPGVLIGHNANLAWGFTTTFGDVSDLYLETKAKKGEGVVIRTCPAGPSSCREKEVAYTVHPETICVRSENGRVRDCENLAFPVREVPGHGPLLNDLLPKELSTAFGIISIRWAGFDATEELTAVDKLNKAATVDEAMEALHHFMVGQQNIVMADTKGDIGYMAPSNIPKREWNLVGAPPYMPLPADGLHEWNGYRTYGLVPQAKNPAKGYLVTANNDPFGLTFDNDPLNDGFYFGTFFAPGNRAKQITDRIENGLAENGKLGFEDMQSIQADVHSVYADRLLPHLLPLKPTNCAGQEELCSAFDLLEGWRRENALDSAGPTLFHLWFAHTLITVFADDIPLFDMFSGLLGSQIVSLAGKPLLWLLDGGEPIEGRDYFDDATTSVVETADDMLMLAMERMLEQGRQEFVDEEGAPLPVTQWTWDKMHFVEVRHLGFDKFDYGPVPHDGGLHNPDSSDYSPIEDGKVKGTPVVQHGGPNMRYVVEVDGDTWRMENILPGGASGDPDSPHYTDQLELWLKNETRAVPFFEADVEKAAVREIRYPIAFPEEGWEVELLGGK